MSKTVDTLVAELTKVIKKLDGLTFPDMSLNENKYMVSPMVNTYSSIISVVEEAIDVVNNMRKTDKIAQTFSAVDGWPTWVHQFNSSIQLLLLSQSILDKHTKSYIDGMLNIVSKEKRDEDTLSSRHLSVMWLHNTQYIHNLKMSVKDISVICSTIIDVCKNNVRGISQFTNGETTESRYHM
jgi:hypothetical protein